MSRFIKDRLIPVRIDSKDTSFHAQYPLIWTPTTLILDYYGTELQRSVGFYSPGEFIPRLLLGIATVRFGLEEFDTAEVVFNELIEHHPKSEAVPEAIYFRGVNRYKRDQEAGHLQEAGKTLREHHPESPWTKRAAPYELI